MRYGHFDDERREYVITRPDTPLPWINYLGSEDYFGIISNTAGGYSFYRDARLRRLTRYRYNNAPLDLGGRYLYLRDDDSGDVLEPELAADPGRPRRLRVPPRDGLHDHRLAARGHPRRDALLRAARRDARDLAHAGHQRAARARPACRCSARSSSACGTPRTTPPTSSATTRSARSRSRTASSTTRPSTASGATTSPSSPARTGRPASTPRATRSSGRTAAGTARSPSSAARRRARSRTAGSRSAPTRSGSSWPRARPARSIFVLGYAENPAGAKFDPPGSGTVDKRGVRPVIARYLEPAAVEDAFDCAAPLAGTSCSGRSRSRPATSTSTGWSTSGTPTSAWSRSTCRARRRCSSPGSAAGWASATRTRTCSGSSTWSRSGPASGSSTSPRPSCRPAAPTTSTSR